jgi:hypothetical protein
LTPDAALDIADILAGKEFGTAAVYDSPRARVLLDELGE